MNFLTPSIPSAGFNIPKGHVLGTGPLGQDGDLGEIVIRRDVVDDGHALTEIGALVLTCDGVHGVGSEGDLTCSPLHTLLDELRDTGIEPATDVEHRDACVLTHGPSDVLSLLHVVHDGSELRVCDLVGLPSGGGLQRPPYVYGELGIRQTEEVHYDVIHGLGQFDHAPVMATRL